MKASFKIKDPLHVEATLTMTLPIKKWALIAEAIDTIKEDGSSHGYWQVASVVRKMVRQAHKEFTETTEEQP